jgi:hypothetical protein
MTKPKPSPPADVAATLLGAYSASARVKSVLRRAPRMQRVASQTPGTDGARFELARGFHPHTLSRRGLPRPLDDNLLTLTLIARASASEARRR